MDTQDYIATRLKTVRREAGNIRALAFVGALVLSGCAPGSDAGGPPFAADILPPVLLSAEVTDERELRFVFDEEVTSGGIDSVTSEVLPMESATADGNSLTLRFGEDQEIGRSYIIRAVVEDASGNSLSFLYAFSGWNPRIPDLLVNELNPQGSSSTPDCIELFAADGGNLGGLVVLIGTPNRLSGSMTLPAVEVEAGDFILVHPKSEGIPEEVNETGPLDVSGGKLASNEARDFWMPDSPGLPGNNGAVTLLTRKDGPVLDAVIWSNREDDPDDEKLGWTSEGYAFAADLGAVGAWTAAENGVPWPSEAVDVSTSTATRSLCRASVPEDTDTRADWHTVPTGGKTFGAPNDDSVYIP